MALAAAVLFSRSVPRVSRRSHNSSETHRRDPSGRQWIHNGKISRMRIGPTPGRAQGAARSTIQTRTSAVFRRGLGRSGSPAPPAAVPNLTFKSGSGRSHGGSGGRIGGPIIALGIRGEESAPARSTIQTRAAPIFLPAPLAPVTVRPLVYMLGTCGLATP